MPLALGGLSAWLSREGIAYSAALYKPLLYPPRWVFAAVWTLLYIMMGTAACLVYCSEASQPRKKRALTIYGVQLALNFLWPLLFFRFGLLWLAFFWLLLLCAMVWVCMVLFRYIVRRAGKLMLPYLLWLLFAAYLNLGVCILN